MLTLITRKKQTTPTNPALLTMKEDDPRLVTSESGETQNLVSLQLFHWMKGMGSALMALQAPESKESASRSRWDYSGTKIDLFSWII